MTKVNTQQLHEMNGKLHPKCYSVAQRTLYLAFLSDSDSEYNNRMKDNCLYCGEKLHCNGEIKNHEFKKLSFEESNKYKLLTGKCVTNYICINCSLISTIDSSD
jgi:hypothetical protein